MAINLRRVVTGHAPNGTPIVSIDDLTWATFLSLAWHQAVGLRFLAGSGRKVCTSGGLVGVRWWPTCAP